MQKRFEREFETENRPDNSASVSAYETERSISSGPVAATKHDDKRDEEKVKGGAEHELRVDRVVLEVGGQQAGRGGDAREGRHDDLWDVQ